MQKFRMRGRIIEVYRYKVIAELEDGKCIIKYYLTQDEAQVFAKQTNSAVTKLNSSDYDWMDGIEVSDVPDTYAEAVKIYEMGQVEYERRKAFEESKKNEQLRADLDYVILMGGL